LQSCGAIGSQDHPLSASAEHSGAGPPDKLIPWLLPGIGRTHFNTEKFEESLTVLNKLPVMYPASDCAPEAIFLRGVALNKSSHDPKPLRAAYDKLTADYPQSEWTKRAYPYRLIN
jgi:hypothetical protein